jgi:chromosome segregation ATPase
MSGIMSEESEAIKAYISILKKNLADLVERYNKARAELKRLEEELKEHKILIDWMDKSIKMFEKAKNMDELNRMIDKSLKELERKHPQFAEKLKQIKPPVGKDTMIV